MILKIGKGVGLNGVSDPAMSARATELNVLQAVWYVYLQE
jgi:hypothetical protein